MNPNLSHESREELRRELDPILAKVEAEVEVPEGSALFVKGSVAQGFANSRSDIDLVFVSDSDEVLPTMRTMLFIDGRRIEVFYRTVETMHALARSVDALPAAPGVTRDYALLHDYQQTCDAVVLVDRPFFQSVLGVFDRSRAAALAAFYFEDQAHMCMQRAIVCLELQSSLRAVTWCRSALVNAAKYWAANHGECYMTQKFADAQLMRAGLDTGMLERYRRVTADSSRESDAEDYLKECLQLAREFGLSEIPDLGQHVTAVSAPSVEELELGPRIYLLKNSEELIVLSGPAREIWSGLEYEVPISAQIPGLSASSTAVACGVLRELHAHGALGFSANGGEPWFEASSPPRTDWPCQLIAPLGALFEDPPDESPGHVRILPISAQTFAIAGSAGYLAELSLANTWEDVRGAVAAQDWRLVQASLRNLVIEVATKHHCAWGVAPALADEEAVPRLVELPGIDAALVQHATELQTIVVTDSDDAARGVAAVEEDTVYQLSFSKRNF